jgi:hypothetical protein
VDTSIKHLNKNEFTLTFDLDWCKDAELEFVLNKLDEHSIKGALFFVTHKNLLTESIQSRGHKIGIHPNFSINSTHGNSEEAVLEYFLNNFKDIEFIRTHGLYFSTKTMVNILKTIKSIKWDLSNLEPNSPIRFSKFEYAHAKCFRINFNWEDDQFLYSNPKNFEIKPEYFKIYNFHPTHIFNNTNSMESYLNGQINVSSNTEQQGIRTYFLNLMQFSQYHLPIEKLISFVDTTLVD